MRARNECGSGAGCRHQDDVAVGFGRIRQRLRFLLRNPDT